LRNRGYDVKEFKEYVIPANPVKVDTAVVGIRAFNTNKQLTHKMPVLIGCIKNGCTVIAIYNNNLEADVSKFSPYPINLSRNRITAEDAEVTFMNPYIQR